MVQVKSPVSQRQNLGASGNGKTVPSKRRHALARRGLKAIFRPGGVAIACHFRRRRRHEANPGSKRPWNCGFCQRQAKPDNARQTEDRAGLAEAIGEHRGH